MPRGGKRLGAGRPLGAKNALPQGCVAAIKAANLRVPEDAPEAHRALANRALERMAAVMEETVSPLGAFSVLSAARAIREEVCGPVPKRHELTGKDGAPMEFTVKEI